MVSDWMILLCFVFSSVCLLFFKRIQMQLSEEQDLGFGFADIFDLICKSLEMSPTENSTR